jgi:hypothetical protein
VATPPQAPRAFISYRTEDSLAVATTLERELGRSLAWGEVFLDHRRLEPGESWPQRLRAEVQRADVVLLLIGPRWLTLQAPDGVRRLDDPDDWVRQELEAALAAQRTIIPILVDGAPPLEKRAFRTIPYIALRASCLRGEIRLAGSIDGSCMCIERSRTQP